MANSADRVFHTLELAQQIVFELELKDFFRALLITKGLWESRVPNHVWEEHLMRLGYPLHTIRQTRYSLKSCYMSISQAADAISHGVSPGSNLMRLEDELGGNHTYEYHYDGDMAAPLIIQSSPPDKVTDKCNIFAIDVEDLRLLFADVEDFPRGVAFNGTVVLGVDYSVGDIYTPPVVLYNLYDWSLVNKFTITRPSNAENINWLRDYQLYNNFILVTSVIFNQAEELIQTSFDVWDVQGTKHGEIVVPDEQGFADDPFYSNDSSHYLTILSNPLFENRLQTTIQTWDLERMELTYKHTISQEDMDKDHCCHTTNGIAYICDGLAKVSEYWAVDGRPISKKVAEMEFN
ncbi:gluconate 5-dehydrogenase [Fusarium denticulatum]|uniref:Gluconate 5-dehydrogenase n=1 Tax=Fusarium denticulatum TaxID=48507 RepID=A0A8H5TYJ5_9HYPO|nr:gluconate 5-dehydrogenase [Fusarium denticulatum]